MTATNTSPVCMMTDPNPSTEEQVLNALARAAQAHSIEDLFGAIREITLLTSYCQVPINTDFLETDRKAVTWNETQALMEQWSHLCHNPRAVGRAAALWSPPPAHREVRDKREEKPC